MTTIARGGRWAGVGRDPGPWIDKCAGIVRYPALRLRTGGSFFLVPCFPSIWQVFISPAPTVPSCLCSQFLSMLPLADSTSYFADWFGFPGDGLQLGSLHMRIVEARSLVLPRPPDSRIGVSSQPSRAVAAAIPTSIDISQRRWDGST